MVKTLKFSFEFFPPKNDEMEKKLWSAVKALEPLSPQFVSVTYGAGGSTRERTHATVKRIKDETKLSPAAHLTCINATRAEIDEVAKSYWSIGVKHIVALRGDAPEMAGKYTPYPGGYDYAVDLVKGLKKQSNFEISVAAYPEMHPEAKSAADDLQHLKEKVEAGATRAITQFFFEVDDYFRFLEKAHIIGINVPIIPGILPISNFAQATKFAKMCGAKIPNSLAEKFAPLDDKPEDRNKTSIETATKMCEKLIKGGVDQFHFYTLNRADLVTPICRNIT